VKKRLLSFTLTPRQKAMFGLTATVALLAFALEQWTFPAFDRWRQQVSTVRARTVAHQRLSKNLLIKDRVEEQFARLPAETFRSGSDEIMFCDFLKRIETAAGPLLVKVEPSPVKDEGTYATYRVRLLLSGKLQEIVRFADDLTQGGAAIGIESFALRAIPGRNMCDCTFVLRTVRLSPPQSHARRIVASTTAPASKEAQ
jgi:hypothetical protein